MPLPLVAIPLIAAGAQGAGAVARGVGALRNASDMFPDEFGKELARLRAQQQAGGLGLTEVERSGIESDFASRQAGRTADLQAQQLQQAQSLAGSGAVNAAQLFQQQVASEMVQRQQAASDAAEIQEMQRREEERDKARMDELVAAEASARMARREAAANLAADLVSTGAQAGVGLAGMSAMNSATQNMLAAKSATGRAAAMGKMYSAQMAMSAASAFGRGGATPMPMPVPVAPAPAASSPATSAPGGASPAVNPMMTPATANPFGPVVTGYQQLPDGRVVPVYGQGGM